METEYLVVGSGLTGAVIARCLADRQKHVTVIERRSHLGGNVYDYIHPSGINIHAYGPHYFRTASDATWKFVRQFSDFYRYEPELMTLVDNKLEYWPIQKEYLLRTVGECWKAAFSGSPANFEEAALAIMPEVIYRKFVYGYTRKQWGVEPRRLSASLAGRFDVRENNDRRLKHVPYQGIPAKGYAHFIATLLSGIHVIPNLDYKNAESFLHVSKTTFYTGPIDEFFAFDMGRLWYRGQHREHEYHAAANRLQPVGQVNFPDMDVPCVRKIEWKHIMNAADAASCTGTILTSETPYEATDPDDFEYPFQDEHNAELYSAYSSRSKSRKDIVFCGRLGEYKYYDMDQAIERAFAVVEESLSHQS